MTQELIEHVAMALACHDVDLEDVDRINGGAGFTFDHSANGNGTSWLRTEGAHLSPDEVQQAVDLAQAWQRNGWPWE